MMSSLISIQLPHILAERRPIRNHQNFAPIRLFHCSQRVRIFCCAAAGYIPPAYCPEKLIPGIAVLCNNFLYIFRIKSVFLSINPVEFVIHLLHGVVLSRTVNSIYLRYTLRQGIQIFTRNDHKIVSAYPNHFCKALRGYKPVSLINKVKLSH